MFVFDYYALTAVGTVGAIQIAATFGQLNGLLFIKNWPTSRVLGLALIAGAFVWFFASGERNLNDHQGGLDANAQALFFFLGVITGGVFTFVVSSIINFRMKSGRIKPGAGLSALKHSNHIHALTKSMASWTKR